VLAIDLTACSPPRREQRGSVPKSPAVAQLLLRYNFDSSDLLTRCRLQDLDLGYDRRTLAFQRSEPRHEFGNSDVRLRHGRVWRVPAFSISSLTNSTALGAASVWLRSN
jgi:hypothetical protein